MASRSMEALAQQEAKVSERARENNVVLYRIRKMVDYLYKLKSQKFVEIVQKL